MNTRERHYRKRRWVTEWLFAWGYSTRSILCEGLGLSASDPGNQSNFFRALRDNGLIDEVNHSLIHRRVVFLTRKGVKFSFSSSRWGVATYRFDKNSCQSSLSLHNLCVQRAVLKRSSLELPFEFTAERLIEELIKSKRPDCFLVADDGTRTALEVELTCKSSPRTYFAFENHSDAIDGQHYERVEYVFPNRDLYETYVRRFKGKWPSYKKDEYGRLVHQDEDVDKELWPVDEMFKFTLEEDLAP